MAKIGELLVEINGDNSGLNKTLKSTESGLMGAVGKMTGAIGLVGVAWKAVDLAMKGIDYNKAAEQAEIAFGVFLGSAGAAKGMIEELRDLARETPLEFAEVRDAGLKLQAFGVAVEKVVPSIRMLSDVSAGLQVPIKDLAYLFGSVQAQGKALTVDLMQFANRGIPIWTELAKVTGVQGVELKKMVEEGKIGFPQVEEAFKNMTSEGGKFFEMAIKQMDSLAGSQSNLNDSFDVWLGQVTSGLTGPLKDLNNWAADWFNKSSALLKKNGEEWEALTKYLGVAFGDVAMSTNAIKEDFLAIAERSKMTAEQTGIFLERAKKIDFAASKWAGSTKEVAEYIEKISKQSGISKENIANIFLNSDNASAALKQGAKLYLEQNNLKAIGKQTQAQALEIEKGISAEEAKRKAASDALRLKAEEQKKLNEALEKEAQLYRDNSVTYLQFIDLERQRQILAKETPADLEKLATAEQIVSGYRLAAFAAEFEAMRLVSDESKDFGDIWKENEELIAKSFTGIADSLSALSVIVKGAFEGQIDEATRAYDRERELIENNGLTKKEALESNLADAIAAGDVEAKAKAQRELDLFNLQEGFQRKKSELEYKSALASWQMQVLASGAKVAEAAVNAFASSASAGPIGLLAAPGAALAAGAWAALAAAPILASMPQPPAYANGTDFARGGLSLVGEKGPELVNLPRGSQVKTAEETSRMMGSSNATIELYLDSKIIAESTVKLIDNGRVRLRSLAG